MPAATHFLDAVFPWLAEMGTLRDKVIQWSIEDRSPDEIVALIRADPAYDQFLPGNRMADGSLRYSEAQYFALRDSFRSILKSYGRPDYLYDDPADFVGFFEQDMTPDNLEQRLRIFEDVRSSSSDVKAAFFVYAGVEVSDEELYLATVDPAERRRLANEYTQRVASSEVDYETYLSRVVQFGLKDTADQLARMRERGLNVDSLVDSIQRTSPDQAKQLVDILTQHAAIQSSASTQRTLSLPELTQAFAAAVIGGAAQGAGLERPTLERALEFRQAGIDRAAALQGYQTIAEQGGTLSGAAQRTNLIGRALTQSELEDAVFLRVGAGATLVQRAIAFEESLATAGRGLQSAFDQRAGRAVLPGLAAR